MLALTLRPALAVLGLIASMEVLIPVGKLFAATFWSVMQISEGTGGTGPFIFLASLVIFVTTFVAIIKRVFAATVLQTCWFAADRIVLLLEHGFRACSIHNHAHIIAEKASQSIYGDIQH